MIDLTDRLLSLEHYLRQLDPSSLSDDERAALRALYVKLIQLLESEAK